MNLLGVLPYPEFGPWEIGPLEIHAFGLVIAIGLLVSMVVAGRRGEKMLGLPEERFHNFGIWLLIFGWSFSHVFEVLFYRPYDFIEQPWIIFQVWGSISSMGGLLGGAIAYFLWVYKNPREDHLGWADLTLWILPIPFFFGRIGCTLAFDHPGSLASEFGIWNWIYEKTGGAVPELFPLAMEFPEQYGGGIRHNLGLYEAIAWLLIIITFVWLGRKPRRRGMYLWLFPLMYAPFRFFLDFLRAEPGTVSFGGDARYFGLTPAQYVAIFMVGAGIWAYIRFRNNPVDEWAAHKEDGESSSPPKD